MEFDLRAWPCLTPRRGGGRLARMERRAASVAVADLDGPAIARQLADDLSPDSPTPPDIRQPALAVQHAATPEQFSIFLQSLKSGMTVRRACAAAGTVWTAITHFLGHGRPEDIQAWHAARAACDSVRAAFALDRAHDLGVEGYDDPLSFKGELTGDSVHRHSEKMIELLAKAGTPALQGGRMEISGPGGGAIAIGALVVGPVPPASLAEWSEVYRAQRAAAGRGAMAAGAGSQPKPVTVVPVRRKRPKNVPVTGDGQA